MRDSVKNKSRIWYALRNVSVSEDEWGNTKNVTSYSDPVELKISVSANRGEASAQVFGADLQYDREMVTHDMNCPINEYSRLWVDEKIFGDRESIVFGLFGVRAFGDGDTLHIESDKITVSGDHVSTMHDYEVVAVSRSLNCVRYAIRRVNVSR